MANDEVKSDGRGMKRVNDVADSMLRGLNTLEKIAGTIDEMKAKGTIQIDENITEKAKTVPKAAKELRKSYEELSKMSKKKIDLGITDEDIFNSAEVQKRVTELSDSLERIYSKFYKEGNTLGKRDVSNFFKDFLELDQYFDKAGKNVDDKIKAFYEKLYASFRKGTAVDDSFVYGITSADQKKLAERVQNQYFFDAESAWDRAENKYVREIEIKVQTEAAERAFSAAKDRLSEVQQKAEELQNTMRTLLSEDIDSSGDDSYFENKIEQMQKMSTEADNLRDELRSIRKDIPTNEKNILGQISDQQDSLNSMYESAINRSTQIKDMRKQHEEYLREVENAAKEERESRAKQIEQMILANDDFKDYGTDSWLEEYKQKAREDTAEIVDIYKEFADRLQSQKEFMVGQQEKINRIQSNRSAFDSFINEISGGDASKKREYIDQFSDIYQRIRDDAFDINEAKEEVSRALNIPYTPPSDTGSRIADELREQAGEINAAADELGSSAKSIESAYESIEEIKSRVKESYSGLLIYDDADYNEAAENESFYNATISETNNRIKELGRVLSVLQENKKLYEDYLVGVDADNYRQAIRSGDSGEIYDATREIEQDYEKLLTTEKLIEHVQNELRVAMDSFEFTGDGWNQQAISYVIEAIKSLVNEIQNLSKALGSIDKESGITSLLSQLKAIGDTIETAFNTDALEAFNNKINDIFDKLTKVYSSIGADLKSLIPTETVSVGGGQPSRSENARTQAISKAWTEQYTRYKDAYDTVLKLFEEYSPNFSNLNNILTAYQNYVDSYYDVEAGRTHFGKANISDSSRAAEERIEDIQNFFKMMQDLLPHIIPEGGLDNTQAIEDVKNDFAKQRQKLEERLKSGQDVAKEISEIEKLENDYIESLRKEEAASKELDRYIFGRKGTGRQRPSLDIKEARKQADIAAGITTARGKKGQALQEKLDSMEATEIKDLGQLYDKLTGQFKSLQDIFKQGFGLSEIEGDEGKFKSFLVELVGEIKKVTKASSEMADAIKDAMNSVSVSEGKSPLASKVEDALKVGDYQIEITPMQSLVSTIQAMLDGNNFSIDVKPNMSTGSPSPEELISQMVGADALMRSVGATIHERTMAFNSRTGYHSNPFVYDEESRVSGEMIGAVFNALTESVDTYMHTHPGSLFPGFSLANPQDDGSYTSDLLGSYKMYKNRGIKTQINAARNGVAIFDAESFYKDYGHLFDEQNGQESSKKIYELFKKRKAEFSNSVKSMLTLFDSTDELTVPLYEIANNGFKGSEKLGDKFKQRLSQIWKDQFGQFDEKMFTQSFVEYLHTLPDDYSGSFRQAFKNYLSKSFKDFGLDKSEIKEYLGGQNFTQHLGKEYINWMNKVVFGKQNFLPKVYELIGPSVLEEALGIKDFGKYVKYQSLNEFKAGSLSGGGYTDAFHGNAVSEATRANEAYTKSAHEAADASKTLKGALKAQDEELSDFDSDTVKPVGDSSIKETSMSLEELAEQERVVKEGAHAIAQEFEESLGLSKRTVNELQNAIIQMVKDMYAGDSPNMKNILSGIIGKDKGIREFFGAGEYDQASQIRSFLRGQKIKITEGMKEESGEDWNIHRRLPGVGVMSLTQGHNMAEIAQSINAKFGSIFDLGDSETGLWMRLVEILQQGDDSLGNMVDSALQIANVDLGKVTSKIEDIATLAKPGFEIPDNSDYLFFDDDNFAKAADSVSEVVDAEKQAGQAGQQMADGIAEGVSKARSEAEKLQEVLNNSEQGLLNTQEQLAGQSIKSPVSTDTSTLSPQIDNVIQSEQQAGDAGKQMSDEIAEGMNKAAGAARELSNEIDNIASSNSRVPDTLTKIHTHYTSQGDPVSKTKIVKGKKKNRHVQTAYHSRVDKETGDWIETGYDITDDYEAAQKEAKRAEEKARKEIDSTNAIIIAQEASLKRHKLKLLDSASVSLSDQSQTRIQDAWDAALKIFDNYRGKETTKTQRQEIGEAVKNYVAVLQKEIQDQKVSTQLVADSPELARTRISTNINELRRRMQASEADTSELEAELESILSQLMDDSNPNYNMPAYIKKYNNAQKIVGQKFKNIQNEYDVNKKETDRYAELTMKKARETNLAPEEQAELDRLIEKYQILNDIKRSGLEITANEQSVLDAVAKADIAATEERIRLQEQLRQSEQEWQAQQERVAYDNRKKEEQKFWDDTIKQQREEDAERQKSNQKFIDEWKKQYNSQQDTSADSNVTKQYDANIKRLKNMKQDAESAQQAMRELFSMMRSGDISKEQYDSALSIFRNEKSGLRTDQISQSYKDITSAAKEYYDAQTKMNELKAKRIGTEGTENDIANTREWTEAVEALDRAFQKAADSRKMLEAIKDDISDEQYKKAVEALDKGDLGSAESLDRIEIKQRENADKQARQAQIDRDNEIKKQKQYIKEAEDAQSNLNNVMAKVFRGQDVSDFAIIDANEQVVKTSAEAAQALERLKTILGETSSEYKEILELFGQSKVGSFKSWENLQKARKSAERKEEKEQNKVRKADLVSDLYAYDKAKRDYSKYYKKELSGGTLTDTQQIEMQNALQTIISLEKSWDDAKRDGITLSERQLSIANQLAEAAERRKANDPDEASTKEILEANAAQEEAIRLRDKLAKKISNMRNQAEWRANKDDFLGEVDDLERQLDLLDVGDVGSKAGLKTFKEQLEEIAQAQQNLAKGSNWQQVGKDWQASARSGLYKWMNQNKKAAEAFKEELKELDAQIDQVGSKGAAEEWNARLQGIQGKAAQDNLLGKSLGDRFKDQFKNTMTSLATYYLSFQDFIRYAREAIGVITDLDTALTEMRKVSDESLQTLQNYQLESFDIASRVGTTAEQIQQSTADWMRLGEDLQTAKRSAELSTVLLNVSEFSDINSATESLTAMSQAYQDLDKGAIIDKLNNIGNNFSISTSELAESLQLSAGTLKVAGNSLDEAVALTVAGNQVLQDPKKVGQSLRTISLRLTGTSIEDMQEAGEEIDGLISTQSKLRQTLMDATKVSSNDYKGFDILTDSGNYKSTYEILKGISSVWKEIGEADKQMGTNRQSFILETIAGKTRAAAAASILDNPDILQEVYESSLSSEGSAQQELDKYLDSIQGKVQQFTNEIQRLLATAVDSGLIKSIIDFGTSDIKILTAITERLGGINMIIGSIVGVGARLKGFGLFDIIKDIKDIRIGKELGKNISSEFIESIKESLNDDDLNMSFDDFIEGGGNFDTLPDDIKESLTGLKELSEEGATVSTVLNQAAEAGENAGSSVGRLGTILHKVGGFFKSFVSTIGMTLVSTLASMAISAIIEQVVNAVRWKEIAIQEGKEAQQSIEDTKARFDEQEAFVEEDGSEFLKLRKGVSASTNKNETLSTEDYARYLELNKQMASLFPSLVNGYDSQGNALLSLSSNTDTAKESLEQLLDTQRRVAEYKISKELPTAVEGAMLTIDDAYEALTSAQDNLDSNRNLQKIYDAFVGSGAGDFSNLNMGNDFGSFSFSYDTTAADSQMQTEISSRIVQLYKDAWTEASRSFFEDESIIPEFTDFDLDIDEDTGIGTFRTDLVHAEAIPKELANSFRETFSAKISNEYKDLITDKTAEYQAEIDFQASEIAATWNSLVPSLIGQMSLYDEYNKLGDLKVGEQLQQIISDDISNLDVTKLNEKDKELFIKNPRAFLRNAFLEPMLNAIRDENGEISDQLAENLVDLITPKNGEKVQEYKDRVREYLEGIFGTSEKGKQTRYELEVALGIGFYNDPENKKGFEYYVNQELQDVQDIFRNEYDRQQEKELDTIDDEILKHVERRKELQHQINQIRNEEEPTVQNKNRLKEYEEQYEAEQMAIDKLEKKKEKDTSMSRTLSKAQYNKDANAIALKETREELYQARKNVDSAVKSQDISAIAQAKSEYDKLYKLYNDLLKQQEDYESTLKTLQDEEFAGEIDYFDQLETLDYDRLKAILSMKEAGEFENGLPQTFEELIASIDEFISRNSEIEQVSDTLASLFADEEYKNAASNYESSISAANTALDSLRENGELTADEMVKLQEAFPDLTEFTESAIQDKAFGQLSDWIKTIRENMKGMTPEGIEQANTYIQHLIESMGDLANSSDDVKDLFMDLYAPKNINDEGVQRERARIATEYQNQVNDLQEQLGDEEINWNIIATMVAKDEFTGPIESIIAKYKDYVFFWKVQLDKKSIEDDITRLESIVSREEANNTLKTTTGQTLKASDYNEIINSKGGIYNDRRRLTGLAIGEYVRKHDSASEIAFNEAWANQTQAQSDWWTARREQSEATSNQIQEAIKTATQDADRMQQEIEKNQKENVRNSQEAHDALQKAYEDQAVGYDQDVEYWTNILNSPWRLLTSGFSANEVRDKINESRSGAVTARENALTASYGMQTENLKYLGNEYSDLQSSAQAINDLISVKQARGLKVSEREYKKLQNISKAQIGNLKKQNDELKTQQSRLAKNGDEWRNIQSQIDSNNSSIASAMSDIENYNDTIKNLVISDAQNLAQAISTAFSEMTTETGLGTDTIASLLSSFSDLGSAADLESVFYGTANGVKVDVLQLERLAKRQNAIINQDFEQKMAATAAAIEQATQAGDTSKIAQLNQEMAEYQRQQAQYYATYAEQMKNFSHLAEIARADQTANEGADYETAQGYIKTAKELYDKGLIGTDDFKARAAYLDPYGAKDYKSFEENYKKAERYLTDDASGVSNFLADLRDKGLATYDALTGYSLDFADTAKAALQMGMGEEFFLDVLSRINDYGNNIQYVSSMEEASAKASDLQQQLFDAKMEYAQLINMGASEEVLAKKQAEIDEISSSIDNLDRATNNYVEGSQRSFREGFENLPKTFENLQQSLQDALKIEDDATRNRIVDNVVKEIQDYADRYGIKVNIDLENGEINYEDSYKEIADKMGKSLSEKFTEKLQEEYNNALKQNQIEQRGGDTQSKQDAKEALDLAEKRKNVGQQIIEAYRDETSAIHNAYEKIKNATDKDLSEIIFGDKETATGRAGEIETAIDSLLTEFGLAQEDGEMLIELLKLLNKSEAEVEVDTNMDEVNAQLEQGRKEVEKFQNWGVIKLSFDLDEDVTKISDIGTLQQRKNSIAQQKQYVPTGSDAQKYLQNLEDTYGAQIHIQTILDNADNATAELEHLKELANSDNFEAEIKAYLGPDSQATDEEIEQMRQNLLDMSAEEHPLVIKIDDTQFNELIDTINGTEADITVGAKTEKGEKNVAGFVKDTEKQHPSITVDSNTTPATAGAAGAVSSISRMSATINVGVSGLEAVKSNVLSTINSLRNQAPIIIKTAVQRISSGGGPGEATGTFHAKASGTAYNVLNYKPVSSYASGRNVTVGKEEDALVGELSPNKPESIVRDGKWMILPGGPHIEHLKKNDIVFSAQQTEDLLKHGRTGTSGKLIGARSLATGTIYNGISAYDPGTSGAAGSGSAGSGAAGSNIKIPSWTPGATNANTNAVNNSTKAVNNAGKQVDKAATGLENFKKWTEKWKDWIEVRLERLQQSIDRNTAKSENEIATTKQNELLQKAMDIIGNATNPRKSDREKTLIGNNLAGAARYQKHADAVRQEAINNGVVTAGQADDIIAKIKSGVIDLEQYEEGPREFISEYENWYSKIVECTDAIEDLKSQLKDLEQQKLDNITEIYDALISRNKAIQDSSVAMADFYTAMGKTVNSKYFKDELNSQISTQKGITGHYKKEIERYEKELAYAQKVFGKNSQQYIEAATTLQEMRTSLTESRTATKDLQKALQDLDITKIEYLLDRITNFTSKLGAILSRVQTKGQSYGQSDTDYNTRQSSLMYRQIDYNNSAIEAYGAEIDKRIQQIQENGWQVDSEQYKEAVDWIQKAEIECENLAQTNEELKQGIRDLRWEPFKELQRTVKNVTGDMEHLADLIGDAEVFDIGDGTIITDRGLTKLALFATQMQKNNEYIANERAALKKLQEEYENNIISKQKYNEESEEMIKSIQDTVRANNTLEKSITDVYKTQIQNENKALTELIGLRKDALSQKKAYYDYNRNLRDKNKEISQLRAEAAALEGVGNQASIARLAQIRSDLAEKETDLADTRYDHSIEMQQQGYDRLNQYANTTLDKTLRAVEGSYYAQQLVIANMLEQVKDNYETVTGQINTIIDTTGTVVHDTTQDVVNEMPQQLDPLMTKFETYKQTILDYIAQIVGTDENGGIKGLGESITGLAGEGGALATFKNAAQSDFGAATGYVNTTNGAVKTLYDNLFSFTGGDGIFAVFKEAAITHLTGSGGVTEALSQVGTSLDEMLGNLNSALSFNDTANITDSAQVTIGGIITDRIGTLTTRSNEILDNIEKDVYDKIAGITEGIEPSEELNKGNKDYKYTENTKKNEPKAEPKAEPKTEQKTAANTKKAEAKPTVNTKKAEKKPATTTKKAEAKPAATPKATTIPLTAEMRDAVAAATWNGTLGWELNDPSARQKKYEELFGPNNGIQDVVNKGYKYANSVAAKLGGKLSDYSYENLKKKLQAGGFKKGTLGVPADDTYWTHANEMIIRRSDGAVLTPLSKGSPVFPANLAENLWKWGAINPAEMMTKLTAGIPQSAVNNNVTYNNHYDSLLTVNGDVDKEALPELKEILKQACEYTNKYNTRESRKLGRK